MHVERGGEKKPIKREHGITNHICPNTPEHLVPTFDPNQQAQTICPTLHIVRYLKHYTPRQRRNYYKLSLALWEGREKNPFTYDKLKGIDACFWNEFHKDFYILVVLSKEGNPPIVKMKYVDWPYYI
jgi:hypothetical protein